MKKIIAIILVAATLAACSKKDSLPKTQEIVAPPADWHHNPNWITMQTN